METDNKQQIVEQLELLLDQAKEGRITMLLFSVVGRDAGSGETDWSLIGTMDLKHALAVMGENKLVDQALIGLINGMSFAGKLDDVS